MRSGMTSSHANCVTSRCGRATRRGHSPDTPSSNRKKRSAMTTFPASIAGRITLADVLRARGAVQEHLRLGAQRDLLRVQQRSRGSARQRRCHGFARERRRRRRASADLGEDLCLHGHCPSPHRPRTTGTSRGSSIDLHATDGLVSGGARREAGLLGELVLQPRTYAFCGVSSTSSFWPFATCWIASRASSSAWSSGARRSSARRPARSRSGWSSCCARCRSDAARLSVPQARGLPAGSSSSVSRRRPRLRAHAPPRPACPARARPLRRATTRCRMDRP